MLPRFSLSLIVALMGPVVWAAEDKETAFSFAKGDLGKVPAGWSKNDTTPGRPNFWQVIADETAPSKSGYVLAKTIPQGPVLVHNLCVVDNSEFKDGGISVAFKINAVKDLKIYAHDDSGGGIVWRYQDEKNYYLCRMEQGVIDRRAFSYFRVYKVIGGNFFQLASKDVPTLRVGTWHTISITQKGYEITCSLDGKKLLESKDDAITNAGKVGLFIKGYSQTSFDELKLTK